MNIAEFKEIVSRAADHCRSVSVRYVSDTAVLVIDGEDKGTLTAPLPETVIIGSDLKNYSGLTDIEQFVVGQLLESHFASARTVSNLGEVSVSGTGDGFLLGVKSGKALESLYFSLELWRRAQRCIVGSDDVTRGLRVVIGYGPWIHGQASIGPAKMQGFGLIEVARILSCDTEEHLLLSGRFLEVLGGTGVSREYEWQGRKIVLTLGVERRGKFKKKDRQEAVFHNVTARVTLPDGSTWEAGQAGEDGLKSPGA